MRPPLLSIIILITLVGVSCDRRHNGNAAAFESLRCTLVGSCGEDSQFGMVGDSWTDFAGGLPVLQDLHDNLVQSYGFKITSSNLAGLTLRTEWEQRRGFELVIQKAGPNLRYMLLSLGGNDMMATEGEYSASAQTTLNARLASYDDRLRLLVTAGDLLKQSLYGGAPLTWIIHGYDYPDPVLDPTCVQNYTGITPSKNDLPRFLVDGFNTNLQYMATQIPNLRYIDNRGTLGGPPVSHDSLMFDCIHPNNEGFARYAAAYVLRLDAITDGSR